MALHIIDLFYQTFYGRQLPFQYNIYRQGREQPILTIEPQVRLRMGRLRPCLQKD